MPGKAAQTIFIGPFCNRLLLFFSCASVLVLHKSHAFISLLRRIYQHSWGNSQRAQSVSAASAWQSGAAVHSLILIVMNSGGKKYLHGYFTKNSLMFKKQLLDVFFFCIRTVSVARFSNSIFDIHLLYPDFHPWDNKGIFRVLY